MHSVAYSKNTGTWYQSEDNHRGTWRSYGRYYEILLSRGCQRWGKRPNFEEKET